VDDSEVLLTVNHPPNTQKGLAIMSTETAKVTPAATSESKGGDYQRQCFLRMEPRIRAIPRERLVSPSVDPIYASSVALSAAPRYTQLRPRMDKFAGEVDLELIDCVSELAHALSYATGDYVRLTTSGESLQDLIEEGITLRALLFDVKELCERQGLIKGMPLTQNPRLTGSVNVSRDLTAAKRFYEECDEELLKKLPVTPAQLDRAGYIATRLLEGAGSRTATPAEIEEAELVQLQTFICFMDGYEEVRSVVKLLRRKEGDAEQIAPSVFAGRSTGKRKGETEVTPETPVTPVPAPAPGGISPAAPLATAEVPVGHMGGSPFTG
jgi:hypothetical protein